MIPDLYVYDVNPKDITLVWESVSSVTKFNLYSATAFGDAYSGTFTMLKEGIPNQKEKDIYGGKVVYKVNKNDNGFSPEMPVYFKLQTVDFSGTESLLADARYFCVNALDDVFRSRQEHDDSVVYRNVAVPVSGATFASGGSPLDVNEVLGRNANKITIISDTLIDIRLNSLFNDVIPIPVTVAPAIGFELSRRDLEISKIYFEGTATVTIFMSS